MSLRNIYRRYKTHEIQSTLCGYINLTGIRRYTACCISKSFSSLRPPEDMSVIRREICLSRPRWDFKKETKTFRNIVTLLSDIITFFLTSRMSFSSVPLFSYLHKNLFNLCTKTRLYNFTDPNVNNAVYLMSTSTLRLKKNYKRCNLIYIFNKHVSTLYSCRYYRHCWYL